MGGELGRESCNTGSVRMSPGVGEGWWGGGVENTSTNLDSTRNYVLGTDTMNMVL